MIGAMQDIPHRWIGLGKWIVVLPFICLYYQTYDNDNDNELTMTMTMTMNLFPIYNIYNTLTYNMTILIS